MAGFGNLRLQEYFANRWMVDAYPSWGDALPAGSTQRKMSRAASRMQLATKKLLSKNALWQKQGFIVPRVKAGKKITWGYHPNFVNQLRSAAKKQSDLDQEIFLRRNEIMKVAEMIKEAARKKLSAKQYKVNPLIGGQELETGPTAVYGNVGFGREAGPSGRYSGPTLTHVGFEGNVAPVGPVASPVLTGSEMATVGGYPAANKWTFGNKLQYGAANAYGAAAHAASNLAQTIKAHPEYAAWGVAGAAGATALGTALGQKLFRKRARVGLLKRVALAITRI